MPLRAVETSGWFHTQRRAHSAAGLFISAESQRALYLSGDGVREHATPHGLHDNDAHAFSRGILQPFLARLSVLVIVIVLDLTHLPVITVDDFPENGQVVVEGEAYETSPALGFYAVEEPEYFHFL